jgi:predicted transcriptional regulator
VTTVDDQGASLAQLVADYILRSGASVAAFAKKHELPYVSLMKLITNGQPPRDVSTHKGLMKALQLDEGTFKAALSRSQANPLPAEGPRQSANAVNPFHSALLQLVEERGWTTKIFSEAADLSVLTAAKLLKRGELPGRQTTHDKLRALMNLSEIAYKDLLASSRSVEGSTNSDGETSAIERKAPGYVAMASGSAPASTTKGELFNMIDRLSPQQLVALKQFLLAML